MSGIFKSSPFISLIHIIKLHNRDPEECNAPCAGDNTEICGGTWRMNIYQGDTI